MSCFNIKQRKVLTESIYLYYYCTKTNRGYCVHVEYYSQKKKITFANTVKCSFAFRISVYGWDILEYLGVVPHSMSGVVPREDTAHMHDDTEVLARQHVNIGS